MRKSKSLRDRWKGAVTWLKEHSSSNEGIHVSSRKKISYPEVTGYLIPSLRAWGFRDWAQDLAKWLLKTQNADGSWSDPDGRAPYTFDTGQIIKGLVAVHDLVPEVEPALARGCDWLFKQMDENGLLTTPSKEAWELPNGRWVPDAIHTYCLSGLRDAGTLLNEKKILNAFEKARAAYLKNISKTQINTLSHFHAYVAEAFCDIDCHDLAQDLMRPVEKAMTWTGKIPAYSTSRWPCIPAQFQYATVWFKLGDLAQARKAFHYGVSCQNSSGGFDGSRGLFANYFKNEEVSWAIKYFFDAFLLFIQSDFENKIEIFPSQVDISDGRFRLVENQIKIQKPKKIIEIGCGKGRFTHSLFEKFGNQNQEWHASDISEKMLKNISTKIQTKKGNILDLPYSNDAFDFVFCVEALEHAVHLEGALEELLRITSKGGRLVIIDKNQNAKRKLKTESWEQWLDETTTKNFLKQKLTSLEIFRNIPYENQRGDDEMFLGFVGVK